MTTPLHVACYGDLRAWFRRKRRTILITTGALGAGCLLYYGLTRYKSFPCAPSGSRPVAEVDEEIRVLEESDQIRRQFEGIQALSDSSTLPTVLTNLKERLFELINLYDLTMKLLHGKGGPQGLTSEQKVNLWQKLKILSFTRASASAWGMGLSHLLVRVQFNLIARRMYINVAIEGGSAATPVDQKFLLLLDFLPNKGIQLLARDLEVVVERHLRDVSLKQMYTLTEVRDVFMKIQSTFHEETTDWCKYLLGDQADFEDLPSSSSSDEHLAMVRQLRNILSSFEFREVLRKVMEVLIDMMVQGLLPAFEGRTDVGLALAKLVPGVSQVTILDDPGNNKCVRAIAELPEVHSFCTMVYSCPD